MMNDFENWLDDIRIELNEKTKKLKNDEAVAAINANGRKIAKKYGITVVKATPKAKAL
jgi:hypothetical protein